MKSEGEDTKYFPMQELTATGRVRTLAHYQELWEESIKFPEKFWEKEASMLDFFQPFERVWTGKTPKNFVGEWFSGGKLNACYNCVDRWVEKGYGGQVALKWVYEDDREEIFTYKQLQDEVSKTANALKTLGIRKGDRVCIWLPMVSSLAITMLACARIGAIHSIVFGGFSADSVKERVQDSSCKLLIVGDELIRAGQNKPMKANLGVMEGYDSLAHIGVVTVTGAKLEKLDKEVNFTNLVKSQPANCPCEAMESEDPLFILYTSGTTGTPKGVVHTTAGYLLYVMATNKYVWDYSCLLDLKGASPETRDIWYCTADIGWITGHSQIIYGPLALGAISIAYEGVPTWPHKGRFWELCERYAVTHFYTAPTAIRALMAFGKSEVKKWDVSKLKMIGTVGEVCNLPEWKWYWEVVGDGQNKTEGRPVVDTYWQTETGSYMITNLGPVTPMKPGSCSFPFFGVNPKLFTESGEETTETMTQAYLAYDMPWPGIMRTVWGDHQRFTDTYLSKFPGCYYTGDYAQIDDEGYYYILGRADDVLKVSGHRLGSAEVEASINSHPLVTESAVCPYPHSVKGSTIFAFITLKVGVEVTEKLDEDIKEHVAKVAGAAVRPEVLLFTPALPKTRSGKIMRRILKAIATQNKEIGNTMTLANPEVVEDLIKKRKKLGILVF